MIENHLLAPDRPSRACGTPTVRASRAHPPACSPAAPARPRSLENAPAPSFPGGWRLTPRGCSEKVGRKIARLSSRDGSGMADRPGHGSEGVGASR